MIKPHMTLMEAMYKIHVEGLDPGMKLDAVKELIEANSKQYSKQIEESKKVNNSLGIRRSFKDYTGE